MNNLAKKILAGIVGLFALFGIYTGTNQFGNISSDQAMTATTTSSAWAGIKNRIKSSSGTLGSVIISSSSPASNVGVVLILKNATSSTDVSSTTIGTVGYSSSPVTIPFNVSFSRGLVVEAGAGFTGVYTITSK